MDKNEKGFGVVGVILLVVIAVLVGVAGFVVYKNQYKKDTRPRAITNARKPAESSGTETQPNTPPGAQAAPFVNVIQDDESVTHTTPDKIAKTADQASILTALHKTCTGSLAYVTVNHAVFSGTINYIQDGNHASINASVCTDTAKTLDDLMPSGTRNYLHKNSTGVWVRDTATQTGADCASVDGLGYPATVISECYEGSTPRAPK